MVLPDLGVVVAVSGVAITGITTAGVCYMIKNRAPKPHETLCEGLYALAIDSIADAIKKA